MNCFLFDGHYGTHDKTMLDDITRANIRKRWFFLNTDDRFDYIAFLNTLEGMG